MLSAGQDVEAGKAAPRRTTRASGNALASASSSPSPNSTQPPPRPPRAPRVASSKPTEGDGVDLATPTMPPTPLKGDLSSPLLPQQQPLQNHLHSQLRPSPRSDRPQSYFVSPPHAKLHSPNEEPSFTFVCLGVGGGPVEGDCSCYLLKPAQKKWDEGSIVVEGGSWLGALSRVCEDDGPASAFCDVDFPFETPALRAGYLGSFAHSFVLSHAHLDHILGMVLGSASLPGKRKVYGLKGTLENLMAVFNGKIWPKLASWGDDGGPAVYHLNPVESLLKVRVHDVLSILPFALSHGLNPSVPPAPPTPTHLLAPRYSLSKRLSLPAHGYFPEQHPPSERPMLPSQAADRPVFTSPFAPDNVIANSSAALPSRVSNLSVASEEAGISPQASPRDGSLHAAQEPGLHPYQAQKASSMSPNVSGGSATSSSSSSSARTSARSRRPKTAQGSEKFAAPYDAAAARAASMAGPLLAGGLHGRSPRPANLSIDSAPALDSTAFFITNELNGKDVLFFGDVEPDSVSQSPRNGRVWAHAARQFAAGKLNTVFLECSFPASHPTEFLYGHLSVAHVFDELRTMATGVVAERKRMNARRKRQPGAAVPKVSSTATHASSDIQAPSSLFNGSSSALGLEGHRMDLGQFKMRTLPSIPALNTAESSIKSEELSESLHGLSVVIIHVKTALFPSFAASTAAGSASSSATGSSSSASTPDERHMDPRSMRDRIEDELNEAEEEHGYGVRFVMAQQGLRIEC